MPQANKGEWSELYATLKIITNHNVPAADKDLNPTGDEYVFLQILRDDERNHVIIYDLEHESEVIISERLGQAIKVVPLDGVSHKVRALFERIKAGNASATFSIPEADELMAEFLMTKIKASPDSKADLVAVVKDKIASRQQLGFSIKSQVGNPATLLNSSGQTNFVYQVEDFNGDISDVNSIESRSKVRDRLARIEELGGSFVFSHIESETFTDNLQMIDTLYPGILAEILLRYYFGEATRIDELADMVGEANGYNVKKKHVVYKTKEFLKAIALGMVPGKEWNSYMAAQGGYLIVREDGQVVCYHLYNHDEFRDYLYQNVKLDTPSITKHGFGELYEQDGKFYIKLNIQIRFIR